MKTSAKFTVGCVVMTALCCLILTNLDTIRSPAHIAAFVQPETRGLDRDSSLRLQSESQGANPERSSLLSSLRLFDTARPQSPEQQVFSQPPAYPSKLEVGVLPEWWEKSWKRSAVYLHRAQFVGDGPLFPSCNSTSRSKSRLYDFVAPKDFLPPEVSKNPCWYQSTKGLRCVPYVYLAGVAKCGTSDIYRRVRTHPDFFNGTQKEYHWWERSRFGEYDRDDPEGTVDIHSGESFQDYLKRITGEDLQNLERELQERGSSVRIFGDFSPSYMWDPQNWQVMEGNQGCREPRMTVGQHIRHLWPPAKILMTFRHPTPRLYSRFISRIHRTPDLQGSSPEDFHDYVKHGIQVYKNCFKKWSIRRCAYSVDTYKDSKVRLVEGMYPVFMQDWLRIWPREQILVMRYEDYEGHEKQRINEIFRFLGLSELDSQGLSQMDDIPIINSGQQDYQKYGTMLPETKALLDTFYQPFVDQFASILNDKRFLWKDVYQSQTIHN